MMLSNFITFISLPSIREVLYVHRKKEKNMDEQVVIVQPLTMCPIDLNDMEPYCTSSLQTDREGKGGELW